jgi:hypothetical protein
MPVVEETDHLVPNGMFLAELLVFAVLFALLVVWPFFGAALRRQWGWVLAVVVLGPVAGILWFAIGRRQMLSTASA